MIYPFSSSFLNQIQILKFHKSDNLQIWDCYNPDHGIDNRLIIHNFYNGLTVPNYKHIDTAT